MDPKTPPPSRKRGSLPTSLTSRDIESERTAFLQFRVEPPSMLPKSRTVITGCFGPTAIVAIGIFISGWLFFVASMRHAEALDAEARAADAATEVLTERIESHADRFEAMVDAGNLEAASFILSETLEIIEHSDNPADALAHFSERMKSLQNGKAN